MYKAFNSFLFFSFTFGTLNAQKPDLNTISGYVKEVVSGESLNGVNVYLSDHKAGTTTNTYGFYSLTVPAADSIKLIASYVGYSSQTFKLPFKKDIELNISLKPSVSLKEVTIHAVRNEKQSESVKMSTITLQALQIKNIPSLLGEKDVLKVIQLLPGVQKGSEGNSGFYVRGGGPDQNLVILDDATVYNANHLFGFFSLFNGDAIKSVELIKGGFPARYGGRLSSVLDMNMKEGNKEEWHIDGGIGLISSRATIEGPIIKGKSSILLSGRRTFADLLINPILKGRNPNYYFYDINAKINYDFGRKDKLYLSGYFGQDDYGMKTKSLQTNEDLGFNWGNATGTLRWNHLFSNKLFANTSLIFSKYSFGIYDKSYQIFEDKSYYAEYYSGIKDYSIKYDLDYMLNPQHFIKAGFTSIYHQFNPHAFVEEDNLKENFIRDITIINGFESGIYLEDTWHPVQAFKINGGIRFSHFIAKKNKYHFFEPRLTAALKLTEDFAIKSSYASMNQYIHMVSNTGLSLQTDLWVPTTDRIKPQQSKQIALGMVKDFIEHDLTFSLEGYYKKMDNVLGYKEGATFFVVNDPDLAAEKNWEDNVTSGKSWSYGMEFLLRKSAGKLTGWIGYTLSWTLMQFDSVNSGRKFYARYDRRHDISIVTNYKLSEHISLSGTWVYGTGNSISLSGSRYYIDADLPPFGGYHSFNNFGLGYYGLDYGQKNNFRMAPYHRLDLGIQFHKKIKWGERLWEVSVYNLYNRMNPFYYYSTQTLINDNTYGQLKQVSLFPVIPSISYSFKF
jgi:hypothetical protein